jgi:hypothetical protein
MSLWHMSHESSLEIGVTTVLVASTAPVEES